VTLSEGTAVTIPGGDISLEGLLHLPDRTPAPGVVVCHPHPQYGGEMLNNVVGALSRAALACGAAALRFNFRGVGASEGAYDGGRGEGEDALAALEYLRALPDVDGSRLALAGYSFGAAVALRVAPRADVRALIAVSAPTMGGYLGDVSIPCPALLVSGDRDEYSDPAALEEIAAASGGLATVHVLEGVDHFWWGSDERLIEVVSPFLREQLATG
jgi:uncharacterized protein